MTRTQTKNQEIATKFARLDAELREIINAEFPAGTKVKWLLGAHWQHGVVIESAKYEWSNSVSVRNTKTNNISDRVARDLELEQ